LQLAADYSEFNGFIETGWQQKQTKKELTPN